jgi:hypothetical protein
MTLQPSLIKVHPIPIFQSCPIVALLHVQVVMCIVYQLTSSRCTLRWLLCPCGYEALLFSGSPHRDTLSGTYNRMLERQSLRDGGNIQ